MKFTDKIQFQGQALVLLLQEPSFLGIKRRDYFSTFTLVLKFFSKFFVSL